MSDEPDLLDARLWDELSRLNNELTSAHRELTRRNAQLAWLNEQKNQLLGMAAHDIRNPLSAILAFAEFVLQERETLSEDQQLMIQRIQQNADQMLSLVDDVVDFSAIESGTVRLEIASVDLRTLIAEVRAVCAPMAERKGLAMFDRIEADPRVEGDRRKLAQVALNLLTNAIKFSPPGTSVTIASASDGKEAWIEVRDRGPGIPPEEIAELFTPFARLTPRPTAGEKSTGLGLAIVRRIVEAHGGRIEVESRRGDGTTMRVILSVAKQDRNTPASAPATGSSSS